MRVWPSEDSGRAVYVALRSPDGEALLRLSADVLVQFLGRTYGVVPEGQESLFLDVDRAIDRLIA